MCIDIKLNFTLKILLKRNNFIAESVISNCEKSGHYLEFNKPTLEILKALKARINDTQANLKPLAVSAIAHIISSFDMFVKEFMEIFMIV